MSIEKDEFYHAMPAWEVVLSVIDPKGNSGFRPRRSSLHTLATWLGLKTSDEVKAMAKEMQESGKVCGYRCPDVKTLIFYLARYRVNGTKVKAPNGEFTLSGMIDSAGQGDPSKLPVWKEVDANLKEYPYPEVRGFKRFAQGMWMQDGKPSKYGVGEFVPPKNGMDQPYEPQDYPMAAEIAKALRKYGYEPGWDFVIPEEVHCGCGATH